MDTLAAVWLLVLWLLWAVRYDARRIFSRGALSKTIDRTPAWSSWVPRGCWQSSAWNARHSVGGAYGLKRASLDGGGDRQARKGAGGEAKESEEGRFTTGGTGTPQLEEEEVRAAREGYGYQGRLGAALEAGFSRLQRRGAVYLDHAGATLYSEEQLRRVHESLAERVMSNPHSGGGAAEADRPAQEVEAEEVRRLTLEMCGAPPGQYVCIFTAGATAAMQLLAQSLPWSGRSVFCHTVENHTSVLGIRRTAQLAAAQVMPVNLHGCARSETLRAAPDAAAARGEPRSGAAHANDAPAFGLFAYPCECNFSGARFPAELTAAVQSAALPGLPRLPDSSPGASQPRWLVLLDAAKACQTEPPDLASNPADFVALSFYKIFGYPTGFGALLVRKSALPLLRRSFYGGGTVEVAEARSRLVVVRAAPHGFEDGTANFLAVPAVLEGFRVIRQLGGFPAVSRHARLVAAVFATRLAALRHPSSGRRLAVLHSGRHRRGGADYAGGGSGAEMEWAAGQGPLVTFSLAGEDGSWIGHKLVERLAMLEGLHIRTGCMCNPGACAKALHLRPEDVEEHHAAGHVCGDDHDLVDGQRTGAVRVSFGYMSTMQDAAAALAFLQHYFLQAARSEKQRGPAPQELLSRPESIALPHGGGDGADHPSTQCVGTDGSIGGHAGTDTGAEAGAAAAAGTAPALKLQQLLLYPIKSCAPQAVSRWPLLPGGLLLDREWMLLDECGAPLTQKKLPQLALVQPEVDLERAVLQVSAPGAAAAEAAVSRLVIPFEWMPLHEGWREDTQAEQAAGRAAHACSSSPHANSTSDAAAAAAALPSAPLACDAPLTGEAGGAADFSVAVCSGRRCRIRRLATHSAYLLPLDEQLTTSSSNARRDCGGPELVDQWFQQILGRPCRLVQRAADPALSCDDASSSGPSAGPTLHDADRAADAPRSVGIAAEHRNATHGRRPAAAVASGFANDAPLLCVTSSSLAAVQRAMSSPSVVDGVRFRANLVLAEAPVDASSAFEAPLPRLLPFEEEGWVGLSLGDDGPCLASLGPCARCSMLFCNPATGMHEGPQLMRALAQLRHRKRGSSPTNGVAAPPALRRPRGSEITFGVLMALHDDSHRVDGREGPFWAEVGMRVRPWT